MRKVIIKNKKKHFSRGNYHFLSFVSTRAEIIVCKIEFMKTIISLKLKIKQLLTETKNIDIKIT